MPEVHEAMMALVASHPAPIHELGSAFMANASALTQVGALDGDAALDARLYIPPRRCLYIPPRG